MHSIPVAQVCNLRAFGYQAIQERIPPGSQALTPALSHEERELLVIRVPAFQARLWSGLLLHLHQSAGLVNHCEHIITLDDALLEGAHGAPHFLIQRYATAMFHRLFNSCDLFRMRCLVVVSKSCDGLPFAQVPGRTAA